MKMNKIKKTGFLLCTCIVLVISSSNVSADQLEKVWVAKNMKAPESVVYNARKKVYYCSNMNGTPMEKNGMGSIAKISNNGKSVDLNWVSGLNAPKGTTLKGQTLYVVDIQEILAINTATGNIDVRYYLPNSKMLNDITVSPSGEIFVSDFLANSIYKLTNGEFKIWFASKNLDFPNGIWATKKYLYIGSWGKNPNAQFKTKIPGSLKRISLHKQKIIENVGNGKPLANIDGLQAYKDGWLLTDHMAGKLIYLSKKGEVKEEFPLRVGASDFTYVPGQKLVVIPMMMDNTLEAYQIED